MWRAALLAFGRQKLPKILIDLFVCISHGCFHLLATSFTSKLNGYPKLCSTLVVRIFIFYPLTNPSDSLQMIKLDNKTSVYIPTSNSLHCKGHVPLKQTITLAKSWQ
jgi:hypothetical protein